MTSLLSGTCVVVLRSDHWIVIAADTLLKAMGPERKLIRVNEGKKIHKLDSARVWLALSGLDTASRGLDTIALANDAFSKGRRFSEAVEQFGQEWRKELGPILTTLLDRKYDMDTLCTNGCIFAGFENANPIAVALGIRATPDDRSGLRLLPTSRYDLDSGWKAIVVGHRQTIARCLGDFLRADPPLWVDEPERYAGLMIALEAYSNPENVALPATIVRINRADESYQTKDALTDDDRSWFRMLGLSRTLPR